METNSTSLNRQGLFPLSELDPAYITEKEREECLNLPKCRCSNCDPVGAIQLIGKLKRTSRSGIQELINEPTIESTLSERSFLEQLPIQTAKRKDKTNRPLICVKTDSIRDSLPLIDLKGSLIEGFEVIFHEQHHRSSMLIPSDLFNDEHAWQIVKNFTDIIQGRHLRGIMGSEPVIGTFDMVMNCIKSWMASNIYLVYLEELEQVKRKKQNDYNAGAAILASYQAQQIEKAEKRKRKDEEIQNRKKIRSEKVAKATELCEMKKRGLMDKLEQTSR